MAQIDSDDVFPLRVELARDGGATVLALAGEFDFASLDLAEACLAEVTGNGFERITLDLRRLTFIDSAAIAFLLGAIREDRDGRLRFLLCETPAVSRVLELTGAAKILAGRQLAEA